MPGTKKYSQPWEYVEMVLCRDLYHCTPSELDEQDWSRVIKHLRMHNTEQAVLEAKRKPGMRRGQKEGWVQ